MKSSVKEIIDTFVELLEEIGERLLSEFDNFVVLLKIFVPVMLSILDIGFWGIVALSTVFVFIFSYVDRLQANINNELKDGMPLPSERFTYIEDELVYITDREKALDYLCSLEDYLEQKRLV